MAPEAGGGEASLDELVDGGWPQLKRWAEVAESSTVEGTEAGTGDTTPDSAGSQSGKEGR